MESGSMTGHRSSDLSLNPAEAEITASAPPQTFLGEVFDNIKTFFRGAATRVRGRILKAKKKITERKRRKTGHVQITHQLVYQSVAAPQVEPFSTQEPQNNPEIPLFKSYDLVKGKPAGVLIQIQYQFPDHCFQKINPNECIKQRNFNLRLEVRNQPVETKCVPLKKVAKNDWQFNPPSELSNRACAFSSKDFSFEEPVIYRFVVLDTTRMESVELEKYIKLDVATNTGGYYGIEQTIFSRSEDKTVMPINTKNSHIPIRVNIVEKDKVIENELSVKPNAESKVSLGNCRNNINLQAPNEFCLNVLELEGLLLGFTRILGGSVKGEEEGEKKKKEQRIENCYSTEEEFKGLDTPNGYSPVSSDTVMSFLESNEINTFLPSLLPLSQLSSDFFKTKKEGKDFIIGHCDNGPVSKIVLNIIPQRSGGYRGGEWSNPFPDKEFTLGLLKDIRNLRMERAEWKENGKRKYDKLFAVVSKKYFLYHQLHKSLKIPRNREIYGFSLMLDFYETLRGHFQMFNDADQPWSFLGDVAFIREDQLEKGTLSHELVHLLGQKRDFYKVTSPDCRPFGGPLEKIPLKACKEYKITKALETWVEKGKLFWNFVTGRYSIMDNEQDIEQLWIDRESYQRVFSVIAKVNRVIQEKQARQLGSLPQNSKKILVAGFYHKEWDRFVVPKVKTLKTSQITPSYSREPVGNGDYLTFQLKDRKNQTLKEISYPVFKTRLGFLYQKEHSKAADCESVPFDFSYLHAVFAVPEHSKLEDLRIVVLGPKGNAIFSSSVPEKE